MGAAIADRIRWPALRTVAFDRVRAIFAVLLIALGLPAAPAADEVQPDALSVLGQIRGLIKPSQEALLSSELTARVVELPFRSGDRFQKGDVLVRFDCALYQAERAAAKAEVTARRKTSENNQALAKLNAMDTLEVEISAAKLDKAVAQLEVAKIRTHRCIIRAPFDGRVAATRVNLHESVTPNQALVAILHDGQLEIEVIVPSEWLKWLTVGRQFKFVVDETGKQYQAAVVRIAASVDPASQTVHVDAEFENSPANIIPGMSGTAHFE